MPFVAAHRVAITGIGVISAIGLNRHQFWTSLVEGKPGIGEFEQPEFGPVRFKNAAVVRGYRPEDHFHDKTVAFMDRFAQFSVIAAREAVEQAGVEWTDDLRERTAIITGSCIGGRIAEEAGYWNLFHLNKNRVHPLTIPPGNGEFGRKPDFDGVWRPWADVYFFDGLLVFGTCSWPRFLDGAFGCGSDGHCRRCRCSDLFRQYEGLGGDEGGEPGHLSSILEGPCGHDPG